MRCTHATIAASPAAVILGHSNFAGQIAMLPELPKFCPAGSGKLFCLSELEKTREFWPYGLINSTFFYPTSALLQNARCVLRTDKLHVLGLNSCPSGCFPQAVAKACGDSQLHHPPEQTKKGWVGGSEKFTQSMLGY